MKKHFLAALIAATCILQTACTDKSNDQSEKDTGKITPQSASSVALEEDSSLPESLKIVYEPGSKFNVVDEKEIKQIMELLDDIKAVMPDCVNTKSYEETGGTPFYGIVLDDDVVNSDDIVTYFVNFVEADDNHPNLSCDGVDYNIPQEKIDALIAAIDVIVIDHGFQPLDPWED